MSRLSFTISEVNSSFGRYDFSGATKALYNFWLYDLCDVYFEALKPVVYGEDEEAKTVSRNVLYPLVQCLSGVYWCRGGVRGYTNGRNTMLLYFVALEILLVWISKTGSDSKYQQAVTMFSRVLYVGLF